LPNVNDLSRAVSDDVHAEQCERIRIEKKLQDSLFVSQHLALG